ncbi:MAG: histidine phosphatase family protein [Planctomycetes bacterium]|nr:histidine phosphatase family protein [Planctomycetota bacterium]
MARYWLARHGESLNQLGFWTKGDPDSPLSEHGREQAAALNARLRDLPIERALCSMLPRAIQTAELALQGLDIPLTRDAGLNERRDKEREQLVKDAGSEEAAQQLLNTWDFVPPNGESILQAVTRVLQTLARLETGENTLVVGHGRVFGGLLKLARGEKPEGAWATFVQNCELHELEVAPGMWQGMLDRLPG